MGSIALLARQMGHEVIGSDANIYPPMSTQLEAHGIEFKEGYKAEHLDPEPDVVVVGNAMSRGNPAVEYMLDRGLAYISGPAFLAEHVLKDRWVLAVAGTHGKTTTSSMLAWILEYAGLSPGFIIGGIPENFGLSARLGDAPFFVVEADEYDTAFFDKRSKFVHYHPRTLVLNNLEYDHADIFPDLDAIKTQFHHLIRTVPANGLIVSPADDRNLEDVLAMGCWTPVESFRTEGTIPAQWTVNLEAKDGGTFDVYCDGENTGKVTWSLYGQHNVHNALAAIAAARHAGVPVAQSLKALAGFTNAKRRMELIGEINGVSVYDDFAHHPTAIAMTLTGLCNRLAADQNARVIAVVEPRSNTMRMGIHKNALADALKTADKVYLYQPENLDWSLTEAVASISEKTTVSDKIETIINDVVTDAGPADHVVIMSNGSFEGIHDRLIDALEEKVAAING